MILPCLSTNQIITLPLSKKEKLYPSSNRKEYHVYPSWHFSEFNVLNDNDKLLITSPYCNFWRVWWWINHNSRISGDESSCFSLEVFINRISCCMEWTCQSAKHPAFTWFVQDATVGNICWRPWIWYKATCTIWLGIFVKNLTAMVTKHPQKCLHSM